MILEQVKFSQLYLFSNELQQNNPVTLLTERPYCCLVYSNPTFKHVPRVVSENCLLSDRNLSGEDPGSRWVATILVSTGAAAFWISWGVLLGSMIEGNCINPAWN